MYIQYTVSDYTEFDKGTNAISLAVKMFTFPVLCYHYFSQENITVSRHQ